MLETLIGVRLFAFLLVFTRVGAAFMVLPGFADSYVSARIRLMFALAVSVVATPVLSSRLPEMPSALPALFILLASEIVIGLFLGTIARILVSALETAGMIISHQTGLANAFVFNPSMAAQGSLAGAMLATVGTVLIFVTDLHHLMIRAIIDSYDLFLPGESLPWGDLAEMISVLAAQSFTVGARMAAPFLVVGLLFYLGLGMLARLMPQVQVFFIAMPIQIMLGIILLALTLSAAMLYWLGGFEAAFVSFLPLG